MTTVSAQGLKIKTVGHNSQDYLPHSHAGEVAAEARRWIDSDL
jgi:hypothetical protein